MCSRGTSFRQRMACACLPLTGLAGGVILTGLAVAVWANVLEGVVIALLGVAASLAFFTALQLWRADTRLIHHYYPPAAEAQPEPEPVQWWDRAQLSRGSRTTTAATPGSQPAATAPTRPRTAAPDTADQLPVWAARR